MVPWPGEVLELVPGERSCDLVGVCETVNAKHAGERTNTKGRDVGLQARTRT